MPFLRKQISDKNTSIPKPYPKDISHPSFQKSSCYLPMSDGTKIALDVFVPGHQEGETFPTMLHQTRYWRKMNFIWPLNTLFKWLDIRTMDQIRSYFIKRGYAWVNVDVRGTGASYGVWKTPWWEKEITDGAEIVDWIIQQPWSNQNVGCTGISYSGTSAEFLLVNQHPNVKACIPKFSLFDVYDDIVFPGGVFLRWFVENWEILNAQLDRNKIPKASWMRFLIRGVSPAAGKTALQEAIKDHEHNTDIAGEARVLTYRDDASPVIGEKMDTFSPHEHMDAINASRVPVYSWSGWADGTYQHAAIKRFLTLDHPQKKLILGPWDHGGKYNIDAQTPAKFDRFGEMMKFFDFYLKDEANGLTEEAPVHYYTMQQGKWKSASTWPPQECVEKTFYLSDHQSLLKESPKASSPEKSTYTSMLDFSSGKYTRYTGLTGLIKTPRLYRNWTKTAASLFHFTMPPLNTPLEITGHPWVQLYASTDQTDGNIFVYLQDVAPEGQVNYISEGQLRLIHRKAFDEAMDMHQDATRVRSYLQKQMAPVVPHEVMELAFDILPTSYLVRKGHRIRISLACADSGYFATLVKPPVALQVFHSPVYPSRLVLPVSEGAIS